MSQIQNIYSKFSLYAIGIISLVLIYFFIWRTNAIGYSSVIGGDGNDYYSYLMSIFIDKNLGHQDTTPWYVIQTPTGTINVHTVGVSLMLLPFFALGYLWANLGAYDINGISEPFQKMISFGALFYCLVGLYFIRKLLIELNIKDPAIAVTLLVLFFGTNLLNYSLNEPSMSHVYSFGCISVFLYTSYKVFHSGEAKYFFLSGLALGLIVLVRPINGIVVFIVPLWSASLSEWITNMRSILFNAKAKMVMAGAVFKLVVFIQALVWYNQNGKLLQWSYKDNGLYFFDPQTFKMLFGFNSGFFIYTPVCLLLMLGLIPLYKENSYKFFVLLTFVVFVFYLFSCHWAYTYFDGLSIRPLVDFYAVFAIIGAVVFNKLSNVKVKSVYSAGIVLTVFFNLMFCYQYKAGILPPAGMNYAKFKYILFKTDVKYAGVLGGCNDLKPYAKKHPTVAFKYQNAFGATQYFNYKDKEYGVFYEVSQLGFATSKIYVKVDLRRKEGVMNASGNAVVVFRIEAPDKTPRSYQVYKLNDVPAEECCEWQSCHFAVTMDGKIQATDKLVVYVWNKEKKEFYIDDFKVQVFNYNYNS